MNGVVKTTRNLVKKYPMITNKTILVLNITQISKRSVNSRQLTSVNNWFFIIGIKYAFSLL